MQPRAAADPADRAPLALLVVDDDEVDRQAVLRALAACRMPVRVLTAESAAQALEILQAQPIDCLLLDHELPPTTGLQVLQQIRQQGNALPVIVLTGHGNEELAVEVMQAGAHDYIAKHSLRPERLKMAVLGAIKLAQAQEAASRAQAALQQQVQFAELLLGVVSHDLRNPLHAINLGAAYLDRRPELSLEARQSVARIRRSGQRAMRLIHDLLDFTQVRAGQGIPVNRVPMDLYDTAISIVDEFASSYPDRTFELRARPGTLGVWDADRIAQVLTNLMSNAVAYGKPQEPVVIEVSLHDEDARLEVTNAGAPIPQELLPLLFEPMRRLTSVATASGNIGLGLFIVDQIARAHGGHVQVMSMPDRTSFTVRLPLHAAG